MKFENHQAFSRQPCLEFGEQKGRDLERLAKGEKEVPQGEGVCNVLKRDACGRATHKAKRKEQHDYWRVWSVGGYTAHICTHMHSPASLSQATLGKLIVYGKGGACATLSEAPGQQQGDKGLKQTA